VPIVLLHGGALTIETTFSPEQIARFACRRPLIAIEQQAHGNTADRPGKPITIHQMVKDTAGVLVHLKVRQADLFGHSLGRIIATGMATRPRSRASFPMPAARCCPARRTSALSSATMARANDRDPHAAQLVSVIIEALESSAPQLHFE